MPSKLALKRSKKQPNNTASKNTEKARPALRSGGPFYSGSIMTNIDHLLATYGSLAPGEVNHHELEGLSGTWRSGYVTGTLVTKGWGADIGYPALIPDPRGDRVDVQLFHSADLPAHWDRLDEFEGEGYRRAIISVSTPDGPVDAWIYLDAD